MLNNLNPSAPPLLSVRALSVRAPTASSSSNMLLRDVEFDIFAGEIVGVIGLSGSSKTTLLETLKGVRTPERGSQILLHGRPLSDQAESLVRLGFGPQQDPLHEKLTIHETLSYAARLRSAGPADPAVQKRMAQALELVASVDKDIVVGTDAHPERKTLSGGERKRVSLGVEMVSDAELLLLDEPMSGLSVPDGKLVMQALRSQAELGRAIIMVAHEASPDFYHFVDRVILMDQGTAVFVGSPDVVFERVEALWSAQADLAAEAASKRASLSAPDRFWQAYQRLRSQGPMQLDCSDAVRELSPLTATHASSPGDGSARVRVIDTKEAVPILFEREQKIFLRDERALIEAWLVPFLLACSGTIIMHGEPRMLLALVSFVAFILGALPASICVVSEWPLYHRERMAGIPDSGYVLAKLLLLGGVGVLRILVLTVTVCVLSYVPWLQTSLLISPVLLFVGLWVSYIAGASLGLLVSCHLQTERSVSVIMVLLLGIILTLSGMFLPPSAEINQLFYVFEASPVRWVYGALLVENMTEPLLALGLGFDAYWSNLLCALAVGALAVGLTRVALKWRVGA